LAKNRDFTHYPARQAIGAVVGVNAWLQQLQESMKFLGYILLG